MLDIIELTWLYYLLKGFVDQSSYCASDIVLLLWRSRSKKLRLPGCFVSSDWSTKSQSTWFRLLNDVIHCCISFGIKLNVYNKAVPITLQIKHRLHKIYCIKFIASNFQLQKVVICWQLNPLPQSHLLGKSRLPLKSYFISKIIGCIIRMEKTGTSDRFWLPTDNTIASFQFQISVNHYLAHATNLRFSS